jgi:hypothetical protein
MISMEPQYEFILVVRGFLWVQLDVIKAETIISEVDRCPHRQGKGQDEEGAQDVFVKNAQSELPDVQVD